MMSVIVQRAAGVSGAAERAVTRAGGTIGQQIGIIDGFTAKVPSNVVSTLQHTKGISWVSPDGKVQLLGMNDNGYDAKSDKHSVYSATVDDGAQSLWAQGATGQGVDVAIIDSGIAPVDGLNAPGKVVNGPDLSFESQDDSVAHIDTYGHGTHMAGIIAGRDTDAVSGSYVGDSTHFLGMAPDARLVSIKVADANGATDVSQMLAAIDWVVQHKDDAGMHIRVLNLSFGTDSQQDYTHDPLAFAAEAAWRAGIVVVAAAGNAGYATGRTAPGLTDPAYDPYVIAVGAADTNGTADRSDDTVADFSSSASSNKDRLPDVVAPGTSVASLRVPGSHADDEFGNGPGSVNDRFLRGSGTSQAAAAVSGAAALLLSQRPNLTPDQVKRLLTTTADKLPNVAAVSQGNGELDLAQAGRTSTPKYTQSWPKSNGDGSLELSRGSTHLVDDNGVALTGEVDIFGNKIDTRKLASAESKGVAWGTDGSWNGSVWTGVSFGGGDSLSGHSWSGHSWSGHSWSGHSWSDYSWSGHSWSGHSWSGHSWSGHSWSGHSWSDNSWSDGTWT
jgi:serine protease AprX